MNIIDLATYRRTGKIAPPIQCVYSDEVIAHARRVQHMFDAMEEQRWNEAVSVLHGSYAEKPCDV